MSGKPVFPRFANIGCLTLDIIEVFKHVLRRFRAASFQLATVTNGSWKLTPRSVALSVTEVARLSQKQDSALATETLREFRYGSAAKAYATQLGFVRNGSRQTFAKQDSALASETLREFRYGSVPQAYATPLGFVRNGSRQTFAKTRFSFSHRNSPRVPLRFRGESLRHAVRFCL